MNAAKYFIPFGSIKHHPKAWWSAEVKEAVSERRKAFAAAQRCDEGHQAYITSSQRALSVIAKAKREACRRLALLSCPNLTLNLCILSFVLLLALLPHLSPLLTSQLFLSHYVSFALRQLSEIPLFCLPAKGFG